LQSFNKKKSEKSGGVAKLLFNFHPPINLWSTFLTCTFLFAEWVWYSDAHLNIGKVFRWVSPLFKSREPFEYRTKKCLKSVVFGFQMFGNQMNTVQLISDSNEKLHWFSKLNYLIATQIKFLCKIIFFLTTTAGVMMWNFYNSFKFFDAISAMCFKYNFSHN
jgi:hypothetical protein